jgi:lysophospholipase L1-like esterase
MRFASKLRIVIAALALCGAALGQQKINPATQINWPALCQVYNVAQAACPPVGVVTFKGAWSSTTTYAANDAVFYTGSTYVSLQGGNLNQNPATATAYWTVLVSGAEGGVTSFGTPGRTGVVVPQTNDYTSAQINLAPSIPKPSNLIAYYDLHDCTGTTVSDVSGNNNNAAIQTTGSGTAPTWNANCTLNFPGGFGVPTTSGFMGVITPSATITAKTAVVCGAFSYGGGYLGQQAIVGNTISTGKELNTGPSFINTPGTSVVYGSTGGTYFDGGLEPIPTTPGCFAVVYNTSPAVDQIYWNGQPLTYKSIPGGSGFWPSPSSSAGLSEIGQYVIGAESYIPSSRFISQMQGTLGAAGFWNTQLTQNDIMQQYQSWISFNTNRGITITSPPAIYNGVVINPANVNIPCYGDSITFGLGVAFADSYCVYAVAQGQLAGLGTVVSVPRGVTGEPAADGWQRAVGSGLEFGAKPRVATFFEGTNDGCNASNITNTGALVTYYTNLANAIHKQKGILLLGTMLSRTGCDAWKNTLNGIIRNLAAQGVIDGMFDSATDARAGANGAYANPNPTACAGGTCFQADGIHPTTALQRIISTYWANSILAATSTVNQTSSVVVTTSHQILPRERWIGVSSSSAVTMTLPDCNGMTGFNFGIGPPGSGGTITVASMSGQTITGATTLAPGTPPVVYTATLVSSITGGCGWNQTQ